MKKLFFSFLFVFSAMTAWACDCEPKATPNDAYAAADIVFVGKVINAETNWISGGYKFIFHVERTWKMSADTLLYLKTPLAQDCGVMFEKGKSYLVYANKSFTSKETNSCAGSKPIEEATEDLQLWGEGTTPRDPKMLKMNMWTVGIAMVAGMVMLGLVVLKGARSGRRNAKR